MSVSKIRQNYQAEVEAALNKQINIELYASQVYLSMSAYFDRDDVALPGAAKWFMEQSNEEREHATEMIKYQNKRGGRVVFQEVKKPETEEWGSLLEALEAALTLEKFNNTCLLNLHGTAANSNDPHLSDFLEEKFLTEQVEAIHELGKMITNLKRAGDGLGVYLFDKEHFGH